MKRRDFIAALVGVPLLARATSFISVNGHPLLANGSIFTSGSSPAAPFDFYISPTGDNNNAGTLVSPWSITALNTKRATYAGKRVGLLPGTYQHGSVGGVQTTIFSIINGQSSQAFVGLSIQGGGTYVGSSDSSGNYSPRTATINANDPNTGLPPNYGSTGASPGVIGQGSSGATAATVFGNTTLDGVVVVGAYGSAIDFYAGGFTGPGGATGTIIANCEVHDCSGYENANIACIFAYYQTGLILRNNKLHDCIPYAGGNQGLWDAAAILTQECLNGLYEYNTIYNTNCGIYDKNTTVGTTYRYNYIENLGTFKNSCLEDGNGGAAATKMSVYNNALIGLTGVWATNAVNPDAPSGRNDWDFYNNTVYCPTGAWTGGQGDCAIQIPTVGTINIYNTIFASNANGATNGIRGFLPASLGIVNYNAFQGTTSGGQIDGDWSSTSSFPTTYRNFQYNGRDPNSITKTLGTIFGGAYTRLDAGGTSNQFQTLPAGMSTLGRVGGTSGGAAIPVGCWGGTDVNTGLPISRIGCDF